MSRIGKMPVVIPSGVTVTPGLAEVKVKGPRGELCQALPAGITCKLDGAALVVERASDAKPHRAKHGLVRSLLFNAVTGVSTGYTRELQIEGIGYRAQVQGSELNLTLGFSHPVLYSLPKGVTVKVENNTKIELAGVDKQQVGQVAAEIRALRPPEPYKGKGIRYAGEQVRRKVGKTGA